VNASNQIEAKAITLTEGNGIDLSAASINLGGSLTVTAKIASMFEFVSGNISSKPIQLETQTGMLFYDQDYNSIEEINLNGTLTIDTPQNLQITSDVTRFANLGLGEAANTSYSLIASGVAYLKGTGDNYLAGSIGHPSYSSETSFWKITIAGNADFRYLYTNELRAKSFIADLEMVNVGSEIIAKSAAVVASNYTLPTAGGSSILYVESIPGYDSLQVFDNSDIIRLRQFSRSGGGLTIADAWGTVTFVEFDTSTNPKRQLYTFTRSTSTNAGTASGTIEKGTLAIDYGTSGSGYAETSAIDGNDGSNAPYFQTATWETHPATNTTIRARVGNLVGISTPYWGSLQSHGLYSSYAYLTDNVNVLGSLAAGSDSGFDHTFYAGKFNINDVVNSQALYNVTSGNNTQFYVGSGVSFANEDSETTTYNNPVGTKYYMSNLATATNGANILWYKTGYSAQRYSASVWIRLKASSGTSTGTLRVAMYYGSTEHVLEDKLITINTE
jgi:hypothetical protein